MQTISALRKSARQRRPPRRSKLSALLVAPAQTIEKVLHRHVERQRKLIKRIGGYASPTEFYVAKITEGVGPDHAFIPFHFSGWWQGKDMLEYYPEGAAPIVRAEAVNTATTYGYDAVTMMQETKTTLCQVVKV